MSDTWLFEIWISNPLKPGDSVNGIADCGRFVMISDFPISTDGKPAGRVFDIAAKLFKPDGAVGSSEHVDTQTAVVVIDRMQYSHS
jgi:hypothetical protein